MQVVVEKLTKVYRGGTRALDGVELTILTTSSRARAARYPLRGPGKEPPGHRRRSNLRRRQSPTGNTSASERPWRGSARTIARYWSCGTTRNWP